MLCSRLYPCSRLHGSVLRIVFASGGEPQTLVTLESSLTICSAHSGEDPHKHAARCGHLSQMRSEHLLRISARLRAPEAAVTPARPNEDPDFKRWCETLLNHNGPVPQTIAPSNRALLSAAFNKGLESGSRRASALHRTLRAEAISATLRTQPPAFNPGYPSGMRALAHYPQTSTGPYHVSSGMPTPSNSSGVVATHHARGPYAASAHLRPTVSSSKANSWYTHVSNSERPMRPQDSANAQNNEGVGAAYGWPK